MTSRSPFAARLRTLQSRLVITTVAIASMIIVVIALTMTFMLAITLDKRLDAQVSSVATSASTWADEAVLYGTSTAPLAQDILQNRAVQPYMLLAIQQDGRLSDRLSAPMGVIVVPTDDAHFNLVPLSLDQLVAIHNGVQGSGADLAPVTVDLGEWGEYRIKPAQSTLGWVFAGLPLADNERTLKELYAVIMTLTVGGLLLLALLTTLTIRMSLKPLRTVAATATRVAALPLDQGAVSITERVPVAEADPDTEPGRVGVALNTLLDHVGASLQARHRNEERMRQFVADASHELRTPLSSIRGYSELSLRNNGLSDDTKLAMERIQAQSVRMTRFVEDLLLLARLDEGRELSSDDVDVTKLALEAISDARAAGADHEYAIELPEHPIHVQGDEGRLAQVVTNLLANARTHTPEGTRVSLRAFEEPGAVVIEVADNGPGVDPAVRDTIFERFARADASRTRASGGTGLGLAISKAIVDGHGGTISVESEPGDTVFTVRLPKPPTPEADGPPAPPPAPVKAPRGSKR